MHVHDKDPWSSLGFQVMASPVDPGKDGSPRRWIPMPESPVGIRFSGGMGTRSATSFQRALNIQRETVVRTASDGLPKLAKTIKQ